MTVDPWTDDDVQISEVPARILIVDDEPEMCALIDDVLRRRGYATATYSSPEEALEALEAEDFDLVITDVRMPGIDGVELCQRICGDHPDMPVLVLTAYGLVENAVGAMRAGACEFLRKPVRPGELADSVERAARRRGTGRAVRRIAPAGPADEEPLTALLGSSPAARDLRDQVRRAAASDITVLITGETGTGKELTARLVHSCSARADRPFVAVSCAAIPDELFESELFGHERGAFTGAEESRVGFLVRASGGTLLLDEAGELPLHIQPKLLRALQEETVRPVGSDRERAFDTRLLIATNRDLHSLVEEGLFRRDLLHRLDVLRVHVPPLREREDDVVELAAHFLQHLGSNATLSDEVRATLTDYSWPGNVRELRNCVERAVALAGGPRIELHDLPASVRQGSTGSSSSEPPPLDTLQALERRHIARALRVCNGSKAEAARLLGISRATLYRKLARLDIPE